MITPVGSVGRASDSRFLVRGYNGIIDLIRYRRAQSRHHLEHQDQGDDRIKQAGPDPDHFAVRISCNISSLCNLVFRNVIQQSALIDLIVYCLNWGQHVLAYKMFQPGSSPTKPHHLQLPYYPCSIILPYSFEFP